MGVYPGFNFRVTSLPSKNANIYTMAHENFPLYSIMKVQKLDTQLYIIIAIAISSVAIYYIL